MNWLPLALLAAALYGAQNAFARAATNGMSNEMGAIVLEATAAVGVLGYAITRHRSMNADGRSLGWAIAAGLAVAAGNLAYFALLRKGAGLSAMGPVVLAGSAIVTAVAGFLWFDEKLSASRIVGLLLACGGIALLSRK